MIYISFVQPTFTTILFLCGVLIEGNFGEEIEAWMWSNCLKFFIEFVFGENVQKKSLRNADFQGKNQKDMSHDKYAFLGLRL